MLGLEVGFDDGGHDVLVAGCMWTVEAGLGSWGCSTHTARGCEEAVGGSCLSSLPIYLSLHLSLSHSVSLSLYKSLVSTADLESIQSSLV